MESNSNETKDYEIKNKEFYISNQDTLKILKALLYINTKQSSLKTWKYSPHLFFCFGVKQACFFQIQNGFLPKWMTCIEILSHDLIWAQEWEFQNLWESCLLNMQGLSLPSLCTSLRWCDLKTQTIASYP